MSSREKKKSPLYKGIMSDIGKILGLNCYGV
jgi:hypothetical protein